MIFLFEYSLAIDIHLLLHFPLGILALGDFGVGKSKAEPFVVPVVFDEGLRFPTVLLTLGHWRRISKNIYR